MKSKNKCVKINKHLKSAEVCPREEKARLVLRFSATLKGQSAALSRRAPLEKLHLASIRAGYKYLFVEPGRIGKAKVKEG